MDKKYIELGTKLENLLLEINQVLENDKPIEFENFEMHEQLEFLQMVLIKYVNINNYLQKGAHEGKLYKNKSGEFTLNGIKLNNGTLLEIFDDDEQVWYLGRIEHNTKLGYYHYSREGNICLTQGMLARIR